MLFAIQFNFKLFLIRTSQYLNKRSECSFYLLFVTLICSTPNIFVNTHTNVYTTNILSLQIYIDAPLNITCVRVIDQIRDGTGGVPSFNSLGTNWAKIDVAGQYGKGFHFHIYVYGIRVKRINPDKDKERDQSKDSQSNLV